jgi:Protein of unknown function (DUF3617)
MSNRFASPTMAVLLLLPLAGDSAEPLNVKLGLWEITSDTQMTGVPALPKAILDQLSPEQQAAMNAALLFQSGRGPVHDVRQECLTKEDLDAPFNTEEIEGCERTLVSSTSTSQEMRMVCSGERKGSGVFKVNAPSPETMNADLELKVGEGADPMTISSRMTGKWLGADCGEVADDDR